jgi:hypothetical protein
MVSVILGADQDIVKSSVRNIFQRIFRGHLLASLIRSGDRISQDLGSIYSALAKKKQSDRLFALFLFWPCHSYCFGFESGFP